MDLDLTPYSAAEEHAIHTWRWWTNKHYAKRILEGGVRRTIITIHKERPTPAEVFKVLGDFFSNRIQRR